MMCFWGKPRDKETGCNPLDKGILGRLQKIFPVPGEIRGTHNRATLFYPHESLEEAADTILNSSNFPLPLHVMLCSLVGSSGLKLLLTAFCVLNLCRVLLNHLVELNLLILQTKLYNFLEDSTFVKGNYVVYLFIQFVKWTGEAGIFLDESSSKIELLNNPFI